MLVRFLNRSADYSFGCLVAGVALPVETGVETDLFIVEGHKADVLWCKVCQFSFLKSFFFLGSTSIAKSAVLYMPFLLNKHLDFTALQTKSSVFGMNKWA